MPSLVRLSALADPLRLAETRPIVAHAGGGGECQASCAPGALADPPRLAETRPIVAHAGGGVNAKLRAPDRAGGSAEAGGDAADRGSCWRRGECQASCVRARWRTRRGWRR